MARTKLKIKATPEDFVVEEALRTEPEETGSYAVYRATKRLLTTLELQGEVARQLGVPPRAVVFPALKDKGAVAVQHFSIHGRGPARLSGEGFTAQYLGRLPRHLSPGDLSGNRFTVKIHGLNAPSAGRLAQQLKRMEQEGLPNYFDEQRFGSRAPGGPFIGKAILQGDAEGAVKAYLAEPAPGDPAEIRAFKRFAAEHWGDWEGMFTQAPRSNQRSVVTYLKDHPQDFRRAINLVTPRLLPILLSAYQSFLWNRIASRVLEERFKAAGRETESITIAGETLAVYREIPMALLEEVASMMVPLPEHKADLGGGEIGKAAEDVLAQEGLPLDRLKARILNNAYLSRGQRPLLTRPHEAKGLMHDEGDAGGKVAELSFFLRPGSYATLVLKVLEVTAFPP